MDHLLIPVLFAVGAILTPQVQAFDYDLLNPMDLVPYDLSRTIYLNSTYLAYAVAAGAVIILLIAIGLYLYDYYYGTSKSDYVPTDYSGYYQDYAYAGQGGGYYQRSAQDNFDFNSMNVIQWISMLQELYEKFDYKDLDCQKRLICEVMKEPEYFGTVATQIKNGFQYAKYLEVLSLPDDMRETLDEYMEANSRAEGQKDCTEYFQCPYSLKESVKKNWEGNSL